MEHRLPCSRNRPATLGRSATQIASDVAHSTWQCSEPASSPVAAASCVIHYASEFPVPGLPWDGSAGLAVEGSAGDFFEASFGDPAACSLLLDAKESWSFFNSATMAGSSGISDANSGRRCAERPCSPDTNKLKSEIMGSIEPIASKPFVTHDDNSCGRSPDVIARTDRSNRPESVGVR